MYIEAYFVCCQTSSNIENYSKSFSMRYLYETVEPSIEEELLISFSVSLNLQEERWISALSKEHGVNSKY